jgi:D-alanyl-D-alanine carboxypeptidase
MNRRSFILTAAGAGSAILLSGCNSAESTTKPPSLTDKQGALDKLVQDFLLKTGVPGVSVTLLNTREEIVSVAGLRVLGRPEKIQAQDSFHIGSNAKSMLAMLALRAAELGELKLETPLYELIPGFRAMGKPAYGGVTLEQLFAHRAGIEPLLVVEDINNVLPQFSGAAIDQRRQAAAFLLARDPVSIPGASFTYSNGGYAIAAAVLESVSGKSYERLLEERLFTPLGIKASVSWPAQANTNAPWGHLFSEGVFTPFAPDEPIAQFRDALTPAGNVSMPVRDYAKYLRANLSALRGETPQVISRASYDRLHRAIAGNDFGYALGWATDGKDKQGQQLDYHYGSTDIFGCFALLQPAKNRAVAVMVNGEKPPFDEPISALSYAILALLD